MGKLNQRLSPRAGQHLIKQIADPVVPSSQRITDPIGAYHQQTLVLRKINQRRQLQHLAANTTQKERTTP